MQGRSELLVLPRDRGVDDLQRHPLAAAALASKLGLEHPGHAAFAEHPNQREPSKFDGQVLVEEHVREEERNRAVVRF
jgi:hypothetical protein